MRNPRLQLVEDKVRRLYGFRLAGHLNAYVFYSSSEVERNEWAKWLRCVCVSNDLFDRYKLCGLLGEGSFSHVYKAVSVEDKKEVAIKRIVKNEIVQNTTSLLSLEEEIKIMRTLDHPDILKLYEVCEDESHVYMVEEYLKGGELLQEIKDKGVYSEKEAAAVMRRLLQILDYCHEKNVIHLDLKLENLILM
eukprot:TRINITY_DN10709_c0_g1_i8.p2 TRINITY_DN10709_c0_g1~~TRINITY_DN10709_c0_g1_i8.p2  ORF type:complete len:192 (+),score=66.54 TRINITY_DN10709_c0_g1_i8:441-1016(+)